MTTFARFASAFALSLFFFALTARAQTPSIEVSTDNEAAEFSAQGKYQSARVEVYAPSGELVFEADEADGQSIRWAMVNQRGERVADGVYLATITVVDSLGKKRKRIEQVTVSSPQYTAQAAPAPTGDAPVTTTVNGTPGRLAKFTGASTIGNSAVTEGAGKVGVNVAPSATFQVNGLQPAPLANNGTNAPVLLQTTGGKGGNTTVSGKTAGAGASISLVAGNGGDGPSGSFLGKGGSITLQPGSAGTAPGAGGKNVTGNILLAPSGVGYVGVGTTVPASVLHVVSAGALPPRLQSPGTTGSPSFAAGWDFYHGTVGKGYVGVPGTGATIGPGELILYGGAGTNTSLWAGASRAVTILSNGSVGIGTASPASILHVQGGAVDHDALRGEGIETGVGVFGLSPGGDGVAGWSTTGTGVSGVSRSTRRDGNDAGIYGENYQGGWAGYFQGAVKVTGTFDNSSDRNQKANISDVDPRSVLRKLIGVPVQTWNYKAESTSIRHLGPMAQDFRAAFNLGTDDKSISTVDSAGVAFASIQALYQMMLEKERQNQELSRKVERLQAQVAQQQTQLNQVRRAVRRGRAARR